MSTNVTLNGTSYTIPAVGEGSWGTNVTNYLVALASGVLQKAGGSFTLTADVDFGATYGLKSAYFSSRSTPATAGIMRLGNDENVSWRNAANSANLDLTVNSSDVLEFNGNPLNTLALGAANTVLNVNAGGTASEYDLLVNLNVDAAAAIDYSKLAAMTSANILIGSGSNVATVTAVSGDVSLSNAGVVAIASDVIIDADVNSAAAIAYSKLAALTAANILVGNGSNVATSVTMSGDVSLDNAGVAAIGSEVIVNADVSTSAAIAYSKLATLTAANILVGNGSNVATSVTMSGDVTLDNAGVATIAANAIGDSEIVAGADIARLKLAAGTADHVLINDGSGEFSSEATLGKSRGGAGADMTNVTFPSGTKTIATLEDAQTFTAIKSFDTELQLKEISTPSNPNTGYQGLYPKSDGKFYHLDDAGIEQELGSGGGGGGFNLIENQDGGSALDKTATNDVQDWIDSSTGVVGVSTTTGSEIPLDPSKGTAIKFTLATGTGHYTRVRFTMPESLKNHKLGLSWVQLVSSYVTDTANVEIWTDTSADYTGTAAEIALSGDDSSGDSFIPNLNGVYQGNTFDTNDSDYYEMRIVNAGGTAGFISLNEISIGFGKVTSGAIVGPDTVFTAVWEGSSSTTSVAESDANCRWKRNGDVMEVTFGVAASGDWTGSGDLTLEVPDGKTIDTTRVRDSGVSGLGYGQMYDSSANVWIDVIPAYNSGIGSNNIRFSKSASATDSQGTLAITDVDSSDQLSGTIIIPIAEWAGSGTLYAGSNDVEYYSYFDSSAITANTGYADQSKVSRSPSGAQFANIATSAVDQYTYYGITIPELQETDTMVLQVIQNSGAWVDFVGDPTITLYTRNDLTQYGITAYTTSSTNIRIIFGNAGRRNRGAFNAVGDDYTGIDVTDNYRWRIKITRGGNTVGFGNATAEHSGLTKMDSGATTNDVGEYQEYTLATTWTWDGSGSSSSSKNILVTRVGRVVTLLVPPTSPVTGTSSQFLTTDTALPDWAKPTTSNQSSTALVYNNGAAVSSPSGLFQVKSDGKIRLLRDVVATTFTNSAAAGFTDVYVITYVVD